MPAPHLNPFVLPSSPTTVDRERARERHGRVDLYPPVSDVPAPAVLFVHGGPIPAELEPTPRDWPVYRGYASAVAARGLVAGTVDHRLYDIGAYPVAAADVADAVEQIRSDPRVDPQRIALWFFSGGGPLLADWLRASPPWLRCLAATYPLLGFPAGFDADPRFQPALAVAEAGPVPLVLTRVGRERPQIAETVSAFVAAAEPSALQLQLIDVPDGEHGFDCLEPTEPARRAVGAALDAVISQLS